MRCTISCQHHTTLIMHLFTNSLYWMIWWGTSSRPIRRASMHCYFIRGEMSSDCSSSPFSSVCSKRGVRSFWTIALYSFGLRRRRCCFQRHLQYLLRAERRHLRDRWSTWWEDTNSNALLTAFSPPLSPHLAILLPQLNHRCQTTHNNSNGFCNSLVSLWSRLYKSPSPWSSYIAKWVTPHGLVSDSCSS